MVKGSRWLLLRSAGNVPRKDRVKLRELLAANRKLATVYVLKDDLKHPWDFVSVGQVIQHLSVNEPIYHRWLQHFSGMKAEDARRLKKLADVPGGSRGGSTRITIVGRTRRWATRPRPSTPRRWLVLRSGLRSLPQSQPARQHHAPTLIATGT